MQSPAARVKSITTKPTATTSSSLVPGASQLQAIAYKDGVETIAPILPTAAIRSLARRAFSRHPTAPLSQIVPTSPVTSTLACQPLRGSRHSPSRIKPAVSASMHISPIMDICGIMRQQVATRPCQPRRLGRPVNSTTMTVTMWERARPM